jgi:aminoglycoside 3-N-acetyltransferase
MLSVFLSRLPAAQKRRLKALYQNSRLRGFYFAWKRQFVRHFLTYGSKELETRLRSLGVRSGDTVMLHSSFDPLSGFQGSPKELIDVFLEVLGPAGNLLMVSLPYRSSTYEYVKTGKVFDVRRTSSQMGLVSETFRRRQGVLRSFHPTHPVLAHGPQAQWIVADHDKCLYPCGPGSPFEKLSLLEGKLVFYNAPFTTNTFFGYLEHLVESEIGFPLYSDQVFDVPAVHWNGTETTVKTRVFSIEAVRRRRPMLLYRELKRRSQLRKERFGNTRLIVVDTKHAIACTRDMARAGALFYAGAGA